MQTVSPSSSRNTRTWERRLTSRWWAARTPACEKSRRCKRSHAGRPVRLPPTGQGGRCPQNDISSRIRNQRSIHTTYKYIPVYTTSEKQQVRDQIFKTHESASTRYMNVRIRKSTILIRNQKAQNLLLYILIHDIMYQKWANNYFIASYGGPYE